MKGTNYSKHNWVSQRVIIKNGIIFPYPHVSKRRFSTVRNRRVIGGIRLNWRGLKFLNLHTHNLYIYPVYTGKHWDLV